MKNLEKLNELYQCHLNAYSALLGGLYTFIINGHNGDMYFDDEDDVFISYANYDNNDLITMEVHSVHCDTKTNDIYIKGKDDYGEIELSLYELDSNAASYIVSFIIENNL